MSEKIVVVSGGFDPIHVGHLRMMKEAAEHGKLTVVINSDAWLKRKKGYVFMPWEERAELISALSCVDKVIEAKDDDRTVCETLKELRPDIFANGGDRGVNTTPEAKLCEELGIELIWNIGGGKVRSSSNLVKEISIKKSKLDRKRFRKEMAI
jgi:D-beta-D-heptose 7-phosphate kinase/D-beta-D-heptose 1-phosphate adenosyltransferase